MISRQHSELKLETGDKWGQYVILEMSDSSDIHVSYYAVDPVLQRHVLVKIFHGPYSKNLKAIQGFKNFSRELVELKHDHIVPVYGIAQEEEYFYAVTDYIRGYTLQDWLDEHRTYNESQAKKLMLEVVGALEFAAKKNIQHLFIKPIRFVVDWDNFTRVSNIGYVQCRNLLTENQAYDCLANPQYVSPEQISGKSTSIQTDMYSLGATLYHLLTGHPPYESETSDKICRSHLIAPFPADKALEAGLSSKWVELLEKMLQKKPEDRFGSYADLKKFIDEI